VKTTVSQKGQITIPKQLRERLGIRAGDVLEFIEEEGRLVGQKSDEDPFEDAAALVSEHDRFPGMDAATYVEMARHGVYPADLERYLGAEAL
jgi:antitoxin PrlF